MEELIKQAITEGLSSALAGISTRRDVDEVSDELNITDKEIKYIRAELEYYVISAIKRG